jgi:hypothetical protein
MELTGDHDQMKVTMGVVDGQYCRNFMYSFKHDTPRSAPGVRKPPFTGCLYFD